MGPGFALYCVLWSVPEPLPPVADAARFPALWVVTANLRAAERHIAWLERQVEVDLADQDELSEWLMDARWCKECRYALWIAADPACWEPARRQRLRDLRDQLGWRDYQGGRMPPPLPVWRLRRVP